MSSRSYHGPSNVAAGLLYGLVAVILFSLTLPATRLALVSFDPVLVGLGRGLLAACFAAPLLYFTRQRRPSRAQAGSLLIVILGGIVGFPVLSAWAMQYVPASHGAVVIGLLPLSTALTGTLRAHDRPSPLFWFASVLGSVAVVVFALARGGGHLHWADLALLGAVIATSLAYAEGGRLARELGGWQVTCWSLVLASPFLLLAVAYLVSKHGLHGTPTAWAGFAYVSLISAFLAFFAWFHALSLGGVAKVGQVQLFQPFFTLIFSALFFGETFSTQALLAMICVALSIYLGRRGGVAFAPSGKRANGKLEM